MTHSDELEKENFAKEDQAFLCGLARNKPTREILVNKKYWEAYQKGLQQAYIRLYTITAGKRN